VPVDQKITEIKTVVAEAEKQLAHVRQYASGTEIPTINELRYTLTHVLCYLHNNDDEEWQKGYRHARRALFDAYDAEAQFLSMKFVAFEEQHKDMVIREVVPEISNWRITVGNYTEFSRETDRNNREEYYKKLEPHLTALRPVIRQLTQASDDLNKKRQENIDKKIDSIKTFRWTVIGVIVTVVGLLITVVPMISEDRGGKSETASPQSLAVQPATQKPPIK
jgi:ElaB/YqjD/DUF883 family membrane-anchored ribosome-binding protein